MTTPGATLTNLADSGAPDTSTSTAAARSARKQINNANGGQFGMPSGVKLEQFDGTGWNQWSGIMEAILTLHEAEDVIDLTSAPPKVPDFDWNSVQRRTKAYLRLYLKPDVYSLIASDTEYPTFKHKWDKLKLTYGSTMGSTTVFNNWIQLIQS